MKLVAASLCFTNKLYVQNSCLKAIHHHAVVLNVSRQWPQLMVCLHFILSSESSLKPSDFSSSFTSFVCWLFVLPLGCLPASSNLSILLLIFSLLCTGKTFPIRPLRLYLPKINMLCPTDVLHSILIIPRENLDILISATSGSTSCLFLSPSESKPDSIVGLTTILTFHSFLLILFHCTLTNFHPFHASSLLSRSLHCSGLLTLSTWNPPASLFVLPLYPQHSTRTAWSHTLVFSLSEAELNFSPFQVKPSPL